MGVVVRQTLKNATSTYLGVIVGAINILILYPRAFESDPEYFGLIQLIISYSLVMSTFLTLGVPGIIIKHFPEIDLNTRPEFLGFFLVFPFPVMLLLSGLLYLFQDSVIPFLNNEPVFAEYWYYLIPMALLNVYFEVFASISQSYLKTTLPVFLREVERRLIISVLLLIYWTGWISLEFFLIFFTASMVFQIIILIGFLYRKGLLSLKRNFEYSKYRPMLTYGSFMLATTGANFLVNKIDTLMVGKLVDLSNVAYYSIAFFIGSIINVPGKSLMMITRPIISRAFANDRMEQVERIYKDTSLNLSMIGALLVTLLWLNIDDLFFLLPENYREGKDVVLIIALAQLLNLSAGQNGIIISFSKYYRFNMWALFALLALAVGVNLLLIPRMGITGAAIATLVSIFFFNLLKTIYISLNLKMNPFKKQVILLIPIVGITFLAGYFSNFFNNPIFNILIRSTLASLTFVFFAYLLKVSPEANRIIRRGFRYVGR